jgi:phospholipase B1
MTSVRDTLDKLYNASLPRTLVNLVLTFDVRNVKDLNTGGYICQTLHKKICPCAASPTNEQAEILDNYIPQYHRVLVDLIDSGRYEKRDDFTVVIQPFMAKTKLSYKDDHTIDFSYFAPDCFHFSGNWNFFRIIKNEFS